MYKLGLTLVVKSGILIQDLIFIHFTSQYSEKKDIEISDHHQETRELIL